MITVVVCITCGQQPKAEEEGARAGELFAAAVELALQNHELSNESPRAIQLQRTSCLMACQRSCTAALHQSGKYSYVFGEFTPDAQSAAALLDFTAGYRDSENGQVPYKLWPEGIKGHFVARIPPLQ